MGGVTPPSHELLNCVVGCEREWVVRVNAYVVQGIPPAHRLGA